MARIFIRNAATRQGDSGVFFVQIQEDPDPGRKATAAEFPEDMIVAEASRLCHVSSLRETDSLHLFLQLGGEFFGERGVGGEVFQFVGVGLEVEDFGPLGVFWIDHQLGVFRADAAAGGGIAQLFAVVA